MRTLTFCIVAMLCVAAPVLADYSTGFEASEGYTMSSATVGGYLYEQPTSLGWGTTDTTAISYQVSVGDPRYYPAGGRTPDVYVPGTSTGMAAAHGGSSALDWKAAYGRGAWHGFRGDGKTGKLITTDVWMQRQLGATAPNPAIGQFFCAIQQGSGSTNRTAGFGLNGTSSTNTARQGYYSAGNWIPVTQYYDFGTQTWLAYDNTIVANQWYHFNAIIDLRNPLDKKWYLTINDKLVAFGVPLWNTAAADSDTVYFYKSFIGGAAVDDMYVTVPEPSSILALACGALGMLGMIRRRK